MDEKINLPSAETFNTVVDEKLNAMRMQAKAGIGWFTTIAGLSLVNTILGFFKISIGFLAGLGITQMFDAIGEVAFNQLEGSTIAIVLRVGLVVMNLIIAGAFFLAGRFSVKFVWLGIIFCVLYALDTILLVAFQDWLSAAFHVFALFMIGRGLKAAHDANKLARALA
jgi:hypothetical protein